MPNGVLVGRRHQEDKISDPEKIILDKSSLTTCPLLEGEEALKLLNLQHNQIFKIENLSNLLNLVFLDLSDNCIEVISNLDHLVFLRVLVLARNRIKKIEGLSNCTKLDVLDLSMNEINMIEGLSELINLRVLNLSNNLIAKVEGIQTLSCLVELNLGKNNIEVLAEVDTLPRLQRLFLGQNLIEKFEDIAAAMNIPKLIELYLEGCPISQRSHYRHFLLSKISHLRFLDFKRVLDEEKRTAQSIMRKEEMKRQEEIRMTKIKEARGKVINNAREVWLGKREEYIPETIDLPQPNNRPKSSALVNTGEEEEDSLCVFCEGSLPSCDYCGGLGISRQLRKAMSQTSKNWRKALRKDPSKVIRCMLPKKVRNVIISDKDVADPLLCYLAELQEGGQLDLYGSESVNSVMEFTWHPQTLTTVSTLGFHFVPFDTIARFLGQLKFQFSNIVHISFDCSNFSTLPQINALAQIPGIQSLNVSPEGNPITKLNLWRYYAIYRLSPSLVTLNCTPVTPQEIITADDMFRDLEHQTLAFLPKYRLSSMFNNPRIKHQFLSEKGYSPNSLQRQPDAQLTSDVLMKAALSYNPTLQEMNLPQFKTTSQETLKNTLKNVEETMKKRKLFQSLWPTLFLDFIADALKEYSDLDHHMKSAMGNMVSSYRLPRNGGDSSK